MEDPWKLWGFDEESVGKSVEYHPYGDLMWKTYGESPNLSKSICSTRGIR